MTELTPDDQLIYRFLLDRLGAAEREPIEERLFRDPEFFEVVEATEDELILRYVRAELDEPWRSWFEPVYFSNDIRRSRVEQARALVEASRAARSGVIHRRNAARVAIAGGLIAASAAGVGYFRSAQRRERTVAVYPIDPGTLRRAKAAAGTKPLQFDKAARSIRLDLKIPDEVTGGRYEAVLGTPEKPRVWSGVVETGAPATRVPLDIPVSVLSNDDYILELRDGGQTVASYQFRMQQKGR